MSEPSHPKRRPIPFLIIVLLSLALWGGEYARRDLWEPDEARYAYVAREMRESGSWLVPQRHGEFYAHKPPLMFWLINASSLLAGGEINGISTRIPSFLGALMSLWAVTRLMSLWQSRAAAWRTLWILLTTYLFWHEGGMGQMDSLLCGLEMMALYFLFTADEPQPATDDDDRNGSVQPLLSPSPARHLAAYAFMGLAILAKGPVGIIVPLGAYLAARLAAGERRRLAGWHWIWGPVASLLFPAAWLYFAWTHGAPPEYFQELLGQSAKRAMEGTGHNAPIYYFLLYFPMDFLPWALFLPAAFAAAPRDPLRRRLIGWFAFVLAFFSLMTDKRGLYILAAYPAAAMFIAAAWDHLPMLSVKWTRSTAHAVIGLLGALGCAQAIAGGLALLSYAAPSLTPFRAKLPFNFLLLLPGAYIALRGALLLLKGCRESALSIRFFYTFAMSVFLLLISVSVLVYPALNPIKTPIELARAAQRKIPPGQPLLLYAVKGEILAFYAERPGRDFYNVRDLEREMRRLGGGIVVFTQKDWDTVAPQLDVPCTPHPFRMGSKRLVWVEFATDGQ